MKNIVYCYMYTICTGTETLLQYTIAFEWKLFILTSHYAHSIVMRENMSFPSSTIVRVRTWGQCKNSMQEIARVCHRLIAHGVIRMSQASNTIWIWLVRVILVILFALPTGRNIYVRSDRLIEVRFAHNIYTRHVCYYICCDVQNSTTFPIRKLRMRRV